MKDRICNSFAQRRIGVTILSAASTIVSKFGGTSGADANQVRKIAEIIQSDPRRRYIVVSAPGKRTPSDKKITDLLYLCHHIASEGMDIRPVFELIRSRYEQIAHELGVTGAAEWLDEVEHGLAECPTRDWVASRGEYLQGRIVADYLGAEFVDPAGCIRFTSSDRLDNMTYKWLAEALEGDGLLVIPGFYGADPEGRVKTFSRGGSDVTGAIVARAVHASLYENWTDVDGLLMADPRVVPNPRHIQEVTYNELRELAYMGASVLHDEAVFPVCEVAIPINIRNTNNPDHPGTRIVPSRPDGDLSIVGIAGRRDFSAIYLEKTMMNRELGFGRRVLQVLESHGINFEHSPSGIDSMSVIVQDEELAGHEQSVVEELRRLLQPDRVEMMRGLALIATVGQGMSHRVGVAGQLFSCLARAKVNVRMINQGSSEINIIVGVAVEDYETALQAIYNEFVPV